MLHLGTRGVSPGCTGPPSQPLGVHIERRGPAPTHDHRHELHPEASAEAGERSARQYGRSRVSTFRPLGSRREACGAASGARSCSSTYASRRKGGDTGRTCPGPSSGLWCCTSPSSRAFFRVHVAQTPPKQKAGRGRHQPRSEWCGSPRDTPRARGSDTPLRCRGRWIHGLGWRPTCSWRPAAAHVNCPARGPPVMPARGAPSRAGSSRLRAQIQLGFVLAVQRKEERRWDVH
mmetsp:Transcript_126865/g.406219  ORF Transcript_126865/g.406219 Transcript_126865/m.406219 type:complete len:233 (+) Transcript_126865:457-1155(+)